MTISNSNDFDKLELINYHKHNLNYINEYIKLADTKAALVFGLDLVAIGFFGKLIKENDFNNLSFLHFLQLVGVLSILASIIILGYFVLWPRYPKSNEFLMSWGGIAHFSEGTEYANKIKSLGVDEFNKEMALQNHSIAQVCLNKYIYLKSGFILTTIGITICILIWLI